MSQWVLHTVEKGYRIQFDSQPPKFDTVLLMVKEAIERVPSPERHSSFYSRHFIVLKKDGGSEDWFVMIDVKDKYFHISIFPQHRKYFRFSFRGKAYQSGSIFWPCTIPSHYREAVLAHIKWLRLRLNSKKNMLSLVQRTTFLGVIWGLIKMGAQLSPTHIEPNLAVVSRFKLGQAITLKQFQTVRSDASSVQHKVVACCI